MPLVELLLLGQLTAKLFMSHLKLFKQSVTMVLFLGQLSRDSLLKPLDNLGCIGSQAPGFESFAEGTHTIRLKPGQHLDT